MKLDWDKVREIRRRHEPKPEGRRSGGNTAILAAEFGICKEMVSMIVRGARWPEASHPA